VLVLEDVLLVHIVASPRNGKQTPVGDRFASDLADAVRTGVHPLEGGFDFVEQRALPLREPQQFARTRLSISEVRRLDEWLVHAGRRRDVLPILVKELRALVFESVSELPELLWRQATCSGTRFVSSHGGPPERIQEA
jgi:hypothetical protein